MAAARGRLDDEEKDQSKKSDALQRRAPRGGAAPARGVAPLAGPAFAAAAPKLTFEEKLLAIQNQRRPPASHDAAAPREAPSTARSAAHAEASTIFRQPLLGAGGGSKLPDGRFQVSPMKQSRPAPERRRELARCDDDETQDESDDEDSTDGGDVARAAASAVPASALDDAALRDLLDSEDLLSDDDVPRAAQSAGDPHFEDELDDPEAPLDADVSAALQVLEDAEQQRASASDDAAADDAADAAERRLQTRLSESAVARLVAAADASRARGTASAMANTDPHGKSGVGMARG